MIRYIFALLLLLIYCHIGCAQIERDVIPLPPPPPPVYQGKPSLHTEQCLFRCYASIPLFAGCEDVENKREQKECADEKILNFIEENLIHPNELLADSVSGKVVVRCVVEKDGSLTNLEIVRDIGYNCAEAALNVVRKMPKFQPAEKHGEAQRFLYHIQFYFDFKKVEN